MSKFLSTLLNYLYDSNFIGIPSKTEGSAGQSHPKSKFTSTCIYNLNFNLITAKTRSIGRDKGQEQSKICENEGC